MTARTRPAEIEADRRADRRTLIAVAAMVALSLLVVASSRITETARDGGGETQGEIWLLEISSHVVIVALTFLFPLLLDRTPLAWGEMRRSAPRLLAGFAVFTVLHVVGMHMIRVALFPAVTGVAYTSDLLDPVELVYEARKDAFTYLLLLLAFGLNRSVESARLEQQEQLATARTQEKLILRSGGATHAVPVGDIVWAKAAGNYAEIHTATRSIFARITFARLEQALAAAGARHVRIHRSYIVNLDHVVSIEPTGEGDVRVTLSTGDVLAGSRSHRAALDGLLRDQPRR